MANYDKSFEQRKFIIMGMVVILFSIYLIYLFYLQVLDNSYASKAAQNVIRVETIYPARGVIQDRKGELMVINRASYDLMVIPRNAKTFNASELALTLSMDVSVIQNSFNKAKAYSQYRPSILIQQLSATDYARLQEKMFRFPGLYVIQRTSRTYQSVSGEHALGYIGEVNKKDIEKDPYYTPGDYVGITGIERTYEPELRGVKGKKMMLVDSKGREKGRFEDGANDEKATPGALLTLGIDAKLQAYGEKLMQNKLGSVVAIEPETGEILALISTPGFNPEFTTGRTRGKYFSELYKDPFKPLNNRALQGAYSPGSTFKLVNAAVGLQLEAIDNFTSFSCSGKGSKPIACTHSHQSPLGVITAIETSCNPFFWQTFRAMVQKPGLTMQEGYKRWFDLVASFGFGAKLGIDLPYELKGNLPTSNFYDKIYGKKGWIALTIRSLGIGQGELTVTPLQMANEAAILANRGYFYTPHIVKDIANNGPREKYREKHIVPIEKRYFETVIEGMTRVYSGNIGTARNFQLDGISMCGKTGTVQNSSNKGDHSAFIGFAPKDNPKIAIAVIVEFAGFGSQFAAPIASLMMEQFLTDTITPAHKLVEERLINTNLIEQLQSMPNE